VDSAADGFNSLLDGVDSVFDVLDPATDEINDMAESLYPLSRSLGLADVEVRDLLRSLKAAGIPLEDARRRILTLDDGVKDIAPSFAAIGPAVTKAMGGLGSAFAEGATEADKLARLMDRSTDRIVRDFSNLPGSLKDEIRGGRETVRKAMQDLRFAMEHPFADDKYAKFLRGKQREANRALTAAIDEGNIQGANRARALVDSIQTELDQLDNQTYNVSVVVDPRTGRRREGGAPGRAMGGPVMPYSTYLVGEHGPEKLTMGRASGHITPLETSKEGRTVIVRPVITAFQVGRELGRAATTRRSGAGVL
jgi:hypothetical protein